MQKSVSRKEFLLWTTIIVYTGIIYSTLSIVSIVRKTLEERYDTDIYNTVYWIFAVIAVCFIIYLFRTLNGKRLLSSIIILTAIAIVYWYNLSRMRYPVEKLHFLEYGLLGALLFIAMRIRHAQWVSVVSASFAVYWVGLGDETIQWILPNRVGEIRDSIVNLLSGFLGITAVYFSVFSHKRSRELTLRQIRSIPVFAVITVLLTSMFIFYVHGFGHTIELRNVGRIYSHFTLAELQKINSSGFISANQMRIYENEALRHLHQREFYFTNDFKGKDGTFYRMYNLSNMENLFLETLYSRYLNDNSGRFTSELLGSFDPDIAAKVASQPVLWPDSLKQWVDDNGPLSDMFSQSRVKSTIITDFSPHDMLFYSILIILLFIYLWWKLPESVLAIKLK